MKPSAGESYSQTTDLAADDCIQPHTSNKLLLDDNGNRPLKLNKYKQSSAKHLGFFRD